MTRGAERVICEREGDEELGERREARDHVLRGVDERRHVPADRGEGGTAREAQREAHARAAVRDRRDGRDRERVDGHARGHRAAERSLALRVGRGGGRARGHAGHGGLRGLLAHDAQAHGRLVVGGAVAFSVMSFRWLFASRIRLEGRGRRCACSSNNNSGVM